MILSFQNGFQDRFLMFLRFICLEFLLTNVYYWCLDNYHSVSYNSSTRIYSVIEWHGGNYVSPIEWFFHTCYLYIRSNYGNIPKKESVRESYMRIHYCEKYWIWMIKKKKITPPYAWFQSKSFPYQNHIRVSYYCCILVYHFSKIDVYKI